MKAVSIIFAIVITLASVGVAFTANKKSATFQRELEEERYLRMVAEEELDKTKAKAASLEQKIANVQKKIEGVERLLDQTQASNADLKSRLDKQSKLKESLEQRIKELEQVSSKTESVLPTDG